MSTFFLNTATISFIATMIGGIIPIKRKSNHHSPWLHYIDQFCDSMFIAIALGHILPELYHHNTWLGFSVLFAVVLITTYAIYKASSKKNAHVKQLVIFIFFMHCFMEGLALPIIPDHDLQTTLSITVLAHKVIEPFIFFNLLTRQNWSEKQLFLLLIAFASLTPLGILTGRHLVTTMPTIILWGINALACGTFLGIGTNCYFDSGCHSHRHHKWTTLLFILMAFAFISMQGHHHCH